MIKLRFYRNLCIALLLLACAWPFFYRLGERSFRNPDEGRYAEVAREMVVSGDWIEPTLYGADYLRKPILFYWLVAGSFKLFGMNEWAGRLVPAAFGYLSLLLVYAFVRKTAGGKTALLAAGLIAANVWHVQVSRYLLIDSVFSFFITACFFAFYLAETSSNPEKRLYYRLFYLSLALAFLTKGLAALVIVGSTVVICRAAGRRLGSLWSQMRPLEGVLIFFGVAGPWFVAISAHEPEFLSFFFVHEHFSRFASGGFEHQAPFYYYLVVIPLIFLPWTLVVPPLKRASVRLRADDGTLSLNAYLVLCAAVTAGFYSLSKTKLPTYVLPCVPPLAVLLARGWSSLIDRKTTGSSGRFVMLPFAAVTVFSAAVLALPAFSSSPFRKLPLEARPFLGVVMLLLAFMGLAGIVLAARRKWTPLFCLLAVSTALLTAPIARAMEAMNADYTTRSFAEALRPVLRPSDDVFIYDHPGAFYDFAFYLDYPVKLIGLEGELEFTRGDDDEKYASVTKKDFGRLVREGRTVYCLMRKSDYLELDPALRSRLRLIHQDRRKVLVVTQAPFSGTDVAE